MLNLEAIFSPDKIPYTGQPTMLYVLIRLVPEQNQGVPRLPVNLALVIDNSNSMHEVDQRTDLAIEAASQMVKLLDANDLVSVIAFSNQAQVIQPATSAANLEQIIWAIKNVRQTPKGGTNIPAGMYAACQELGRKPLEKYNNRAMILTDGNTEDPNGCQQILKADFARNISFSTFGLGDDWNEELLRTIADQSSGNWYYIAGSEEIGQKFKEELEVLLATSYSNVKLSLKLFQQDSLREAKIVFPVIKEVTLNSIAGTLVTEIMVGTMQKSVPIFVLLNLVLGGRQLGSYNIAQLSLNYNLPDQQDYSVHPTGLLLNYVNPGTPVYNNAEVLRWVDEIDLEQMVRQATRLANNGEVRRATKLFEDARQLSNGRRADSKTRIINEALKELKNYGSVSRQTQLRAQDRSRKTRLQSQDN